MNDVEAEEDGRRGRTRRTRKRTPFVSPRLWELFKWITAATPVAKFSGGFADPLLKFRWIIREEGGGGGGEVYQAAKRRDGEDSVLIILNGGRRLFKEG